MAAARLEVDGAGKEITVSDTAGDCDGVDSGDARLDIVRVDGIGVVTGEGGTTADVELGGSSVTEPSVVVLPPPIIAEAEAEAETILLPNTFAASPLSVHSTTTPFVLFIGMAKHSVPAEQTCSMTKLPAELQFPTFPAIQAMSLDVQGEEKFSVEKKLLYPCASRRFELNSAGEIEVGVARDVGRVVGICVMVGVWIEVILAMVDGVESVGIVVAREDTSIEMIMVGSGDWKPADAASDESELAVVKGGMIELVLLSVNLGTELAELLDEEERVREPFDVTSPADELGVGVWETLTSPVAELELLAEFIVTNDELLSVLVSDFVAAEPVGVTPSPVTRTFGCDEIELVPCGSPLGFAAGVTLEDTRLVDLVEGI